MRNKKGQFIHNKFLNWRIWVLSSTILFCLTASSYGNAERVYVAEKPQEQAFMVPVIVEPEDESHKQDVAKCLEEGGKVLKSHYSGNFLCTKRYIDIRKEETIEEKFQRYFPKSHTTMLAIAKAESGLDHSQQNWNCWYNDNKTIVYTEKVKGAHSTSCKKEHRKYSWSIDCGVLMKNYIGIKECPEVDIDTHLVEMAELSKKRGFTPWFAWSNGSYKKFLASK